MNITQQWLNAIQLSFCGFSLLFMKYGAIVTSPSLKKSAKYGSQRVEMFSMMAPSDAECSFNRVIFYKSRTIITEHYWNKWSKPLKPKVHIWLRRMFFCRPELNEICFEFRFVTALTRLFRLKNNWIFTLQNTFPTHFCGLRQLICKFFPRTSKLYRKRCVFQSYFFFKSKLSG